MFQFLSICLDNAINNNTLVQELSQRVPSFLGAKSHVRCAAHVMNLMVKVSMLTLESAPDALGWNRVKSGGGSTGADA
jgi:hypothetical protein